MSSRSCWSARSRSSPSMRGMTRSETTIAGRKSVTFARRLLAVGGGLGGVAPRPQQLGEAGTRSARSSSTTSTRSPAGSTGIGSRLASGYSSWFMSSGTTPCPHGRLARAQPQPERGRHGERRRRAARAGAGQSSTRGRSLASAEAAPPAPRAAGRAVLKSRRDPGRPAPPVDSVSGAAVPIRGPAADAAPDGRGASATDAVDLRSDAAGPTWRERVASFAEVVFCSGLPSQIVLALVAAGDGMVAARPRRPSCRSRYVVDDLAARHRGRRRRSPSLFLRHARRAFRGACSSAARPLCGEVAVRRRQRAAHRDRPSRPSARCCGRCSPWLHNVPDNPLAALLRTPRDIVIFAVVVVVAGGVREEVQRAFVLHRFGQHLGGAALGLVAVQPGVRARAPACRAATPRSSPASLGFTWGALYLRRGSVVAPMVSHALFNLLEVRARGRLADEPAPAGRVAGSSRSFVAALPAVTPRIYASDEVQYFAYLRSLWFDRDVSFENEYRSFYERGVAADAGFHETFLERTTETGRRINFGTIGCALLWSPFYAVGRPGRGARPDAPRDGYSAPYVAAVAYGSAVYGLLALAAGARPRGAAWRAAACATGVLADVARHAAALLHVRRAADVARLLGLRRRAVRVDVVAACATSWSVGGRRRVGRAGGADGDGARAGRLLRRRAGAGPRARPVPPRARRRVAAGRAARSAPRSSPGVALRSSPLLPQVAAYLALNGYPRPSRLVLRKMTWNAPHALEVLALAGARPLRLDAAGRARAGRPGRCCGGPRRLGRRSRRRRTARRFALCALLMFALQVYVAGSVESWTVAGAFGQRRFVAITVLLAVGLAGAVRARADAALARTALAVVTVLALWWNLGLIVQFGAGLMDRQRLEPARNAYTTFVVLPRTLPGLVWRYVFDRGSFYKARDTAAAPARRRADGALMRLLYLADIRFPLERANGIQTFETCHALARAGHEVHAGRARRHARAAARSLRVLRRPAARRACGSSRSTLRGPALRRRAAYLAAALELASRRDGDVVFTRDLGVASALLGLPRSAAAAPRLRVARAVGDRRRADRRRCLSTGARRVARRSSAGSHAASERVWRTRRRLRDHHVARWPASSRRLFGPAVRAGRRARRRRASTPTRPFDAAAVSGRSWRLRGPPVPVEGRRRARARPGARRRHRRPHRRRAPGRARPRARAARWSRNSGLGAADRVHRASWPRRAWRAPARAGRRAGAAEQRDGHLVDVLARR